MEEIDMPLLIRCANPMCPNVTTQLGILCAECQTVALAYFEAAREPVSVCGKRYRMHHVEEIGSRVTSGGWIQGVPVVYVETNKKRQQYT